MFIDFNKIYFLIKPLKIIQEINSLLLYISSFKNKNNNIIYKGMLNVIKSQIKKLFIIL